MAASSKRQQDGLEAMKAVSPLARSEGKLVGLEAVPCEVESEGSEEAFREYAMRELRKWIQQLRR